MSVRNIIQATFDEFGKASGGSKKSSSWYFRRPETVFVLNLQKSQYAPRYYVNVALWLLAAGPTDAPKPTHCHVQTRLEGLVPPATHERLTALLDLDTPVEDQVRRDDLLSLLREQLLPIMEAASTIETLYSGEGQRFVKASLVNADGQRLLATHP